MCISGRPRGGPGDESSPPGGRRTSGAPERQCAERPPSYGHPRRLQKGNLPWFPFYRSKTIVIRIFYVNNAHLPGWLGFTISHNKSDLQLSDLDFTNFYRNASKVNIPFFKPFWHSRTVFLNLFGSFPTLTSQRFWFFPLDMKD